MTEATGGHQGAGSPETADTTPKKLRSSRGHGGPMPDRHALSPIRIRRESLGLSMSAAARIACISRRHYSDLEHGSRIPAMYTLMRIARALGEDIGELAQAWADWLEGFDAFNEEFQ